MTKKSSSSASGLTRKFGKRLTELRTERNLTQEQLAARADISLDSIKRFESGGRGPSLATLQKLASALECTIYHLFDFD